MGRPNSYRLINSPITKSCIRCVLEKQIVRRANRLIQVRKEETVMQLTVLVEQIDQQTYRAETAQPA
jgi:hypothetical protein